MLSIKAVLFDLDGTLTNTLNDLAEACNYALGCLGYPTHPVEAYRYFVGNGMPKLVERILPTEHRDGATHTHALKIFMDYYACHSMDTTAPYDGILPMLERLHLLGIKSAVVTNKAEPAAQIIVNKFFGSLIDTVVGQIDARPVKPHPAAADQAMERLGVKPHECLFVGDSGVDMRTAVAAGITAVGVSWGFRERDELMQSGADVIIDRPQHLIDTVFTYGG